MNDFDLGKKVFFLYPPSVIRDEMIRRLVEYEFEIYMLKDIATANVLLQKYPDSLCFVNLDAGLSEPEWEQWIVETMNNPLTKNIGIGIVSYNADEQLQKKYLMDIGISCGFVKLKLGMDESTRILIRTLNVTEAKGRRKFVRARCAHDSLATLNLRDGIINSSGRILDISIVGFSCTLNPNPDFPKNSYIKDIQLKLRASLVKIEAVVFGTRETDEQTIYVFIFKDLDQNSKEKIRTYIQFALQTEIELQAKTNTVNSPTQS